MSREWGVLVDQSPARRAAEDHSRARVYAAKVRFDEAVAKVEQALREGDAAAAKQACVQEEEARLEYQRELKIFAHLVVHGEALEDLPNPHAPEAHPGPSIAE